MTTARKPNAAILEDHEIQEISVSKEITVGVGKFESVKIMASLRLKSSGTDSFTRAYNRLDEELNRQLQQIQNIVKPDSMFKTDHKSGTTKK